MAFKSTQYVTCDVTPNITSFSIFLSMYISSGVSVKNASCESRSIANERFEFD